jgi:transcriptional antiterminator RfaH
MINEYCQMDFQQKKYRWYAVYTRVNQEKKIYKFLQDLDVKCYLPLKKELKQWSDRKIWIEEPFFRCYIFVYVSYIEFYKIEFIPGVIGYVKFGGIAQVIPELQMEYIKQLIDQQEREIYLSRENLKKGQNAKVLYGPFKGMEGEVIKIFKNYRIIIRINTLGCNLVANITKDEIQIISGKAFMQHFKKSCNRTS